MLIARVVCLILFLTLPGAPGWTQQWSTSSGAGMFRCVYAYGNVPRGFTIMDVCFDYGPAGAVTSEGTAGVSLEYIHGVIVVATNRGVDERWFGIDPLPPGNPDVDQAAGLMMDPAMESATLTLEVATISVELTFAATLNPPDAWQVQYLRQYVDEETPDDAAQLCARAVAGGGAERWASVTGTVVSSRHGGGAVGGGGGGAMRQGPGASARLDAATGERTDCRYS